VSQQGTQRGKSAATRGANRPIVRRQILSALRAATGGPFLVIITDLIASTAHAVTCFCNP